MELFLFAAVVLILVSAVLYRSRTRGHGQEGTYVAGDHSQPTEYLGAARMASGRTGGFPGHRRSTDGGGVGHPGGGNFGGFGDGGSGN